MGYIYLLQPVEFVTKNKNIYKIGKTNQNNTLQRLRGYDRGCKLYLEIFCDNCDNKEKKLLELFKINFTQYNDNDYNESREYFIIDDINKAVFIIHDELNKFKGPIEKPNVSLPWRLLGY